MSRRVRNTASVAQYNILGGVGACSIVGLLVIYVKIKVPNVHQLWTQVGKQLLYGEKVYDDVLDTIDLSCKEILHGDKIAISIAKNWTFDTDTIEELIFHAEDRCEAIRGLFGFDAKSVTQEELDYPLAYGAVVYENFIQVMFMLSAFYRTHNEYCVAVSGSANWHFKFHMAEFANCFSNINVIYRPPIHWGSFEVINSTWACVESLAKSETKWMYYQQLSGVDVPLKTNLEMVKILKTLNNTVNSELTTFQNVRLGSRRIEDSPLPLHKSSLSAALPRKTIDRIIETNMAQDLLVFLNGTYIPDEAFWSTLTGNRKRFPLPGGIEAEEWVRFRKEYKKNHAIEIENYKSSKLNNSLMNYYITRHQLWYYNCGGVIVSGSCVFGVNDLVNVLKQPHLIAHKFYIKLQPAAFFCALKEIRAREQRPCGLNISLYAELPQVELSSAIPYENLTHPLWLFD